MSLFRKKVFTIIGNNALSKIACSDIMGICYDKGFKPKVVYDVPDLLEVLHQDNNVIVFNNPGLYYTPSVKNLNRLIHRPIHENHFFYPFPGKIREELDPRIWNDIGIDDIWPVEASDKYKKVLLEKYLS